MQPPTPVKPVNQMSSLQQKNTCFPGFSTSAHPFYYPFRYEKKSSISYFRQNLTTAFPGFKIRNDFSNMYIFSFWIIAEINGLNFFFLLFLQCSKSTSSGIWICLNLLHTFLKSVGYRKLANIRKFWKSSFWWSEELFFYWSEQVKKRSGIILEV